MDTKAVNTASTARKEIGYSRWLGAGILVAFLVASIIFYRHLNIAQYFTQENISTTITITRIWAARFGVWGPVLFAMAGALALLISTPPFLIIYLSVIVFDYVIGGIASTLALLGGITLIYFTGQALGRPFVQGLFGARFVRVEKRLLDRGLMNVIYLRLLFFMSPLVNWTLCVSGLRYRNVLLGTLLGTMHHIILSVWFSGLITNSIQSGQSLNPTKTPQLLVPVIIGLAIFLVVRTLDTVHQRRRIFRFELTRY